MTKCKYHTWKLLRGRLSGHDIYFRFDILWKSNTEWYFPRSTDWQTRIERSISILCYVAWCCWPDKWFRRKLFSELFEKTKYFKRSKIRKIQEWLKYTHERKFSTLWPNNTIYLRNRLRRNMMWSSLDVDFFMKSKSYVEPQLYQVKFRRIEPWNYLILEL